MCQGGNCKTFYECSEIENCCHRLIEPSKPALSQWLVDNQVISPQLLSAATISLASRNPFAAKFSKVLNVDNEKWLDKRNVAKRHIDCVEDKLGVANGDSWLSGGGRLSKIRCGGQGCAFRSPLDKWVSWGREQAWASATGNSSSSKDRLADLVDKTLDKLTLDDVDGLVVLVGDAHVAKNDGAGIDCSKWLASR